ncbi:AlpA family phage regulatory protein [Ralstonia solanacearum]|nr:AlpA family phage regulatory protein [Ralstonia solanacearum]
MAAATLPGTPLEVSAYQESQEFAFPYGLDEADRVALEGLLPKLPPLRYPMTDAEAATFMRAYSDLPERPAWEPILMTAADVAQQDRLQEQHFDNVLQALRDEFAAGRLIACTQTGLPVKAMTLRCFIPRQSAIDFLHRYGLAHDGDDLDVALSRDSPEPQGAIRRKLTDKQKQELVAYWKALKKDGAKACTQQTAKKYDVSDSYVRRLLREAQEMLPSNLFPT